MVKADCVIYARLSPDDDWSRYIGESDAVFIALEKSSPKVLNNIRRISYENPKPIVMFVDNDEETAADAATEAGVSAYVIDGFGGQRIVRIRAIISAAIARFNAMRALQRELDETRARLRERKIVESAEVIEMTQPGYIHDNIH